DAPARADLLPRPRTAGRSPGRPAAPGPHRDRTTPDSRGDRVPGRIHQRRRRATSLRGVRAARRPRAWPGARGLVAAMTASRFDTVASRYCAWLERRHRAVVAVSLLAAILGSIGAAELYRHLATDVEALLPESAQSVRDTKRVASEVGGMTHLTIVIETS